MYYLDNPPEESDTDLLAAKFEVKFTAQHAGGRRTAYGRLRTEAKDRGWTRIRVDAADRLLKSGRAVRWLA